MVQHIGRPLRDVIHLFPRNGVCVEAGDGSGSEERIKADVCDFLVSCPRTVVARDGETILIHNKERGSLANRAVHLVTYDFRASLQRSKVTTYHLICTTLEKATLRLNDPPRGTRVYIAKYEGGLIHCVVVRIKKHPPRPDGITGYLITQFPYEKGGRQGSLLIDWS